ncbi:MAG: hypothetical protein QOI01_3020 [Mycobacterium sp.]|jgi:hypothetical protein|nr:hypothetical protein [Mycobacterium sp.]
MSIVTTTDGAHQCGAAPDVADPHGMPTAHAGGYSADPDSARRWCSFARMSSGV